MNSPNLNSGDYARYEIDIQGNWSLISVYRLRLGLCCINTQLREKKIYCSRTCIRKNFTVEKAKELALQNVKDISKLIEWNHQHNISCLRLSSDMFPHFTDTETERYTINFAKKELENAGNLAKKYGHRIVIHPGQYNQVAAKETKVFESTVADLKHHADILDAMGISSDGVIIVHGGGLYGDKPKTMERWIKQFKLLPDNVKKRLVLENCERAYSTEDCLYIAGECGIPVVFDFHHYHCYSKIYPKNKQLPIRELLPKVVKTWRDRRVLMHISEQADEKRIGAHSDYIEELPEELLELCENGVSVDLEIEAKAKEQAILKLYKKYGELF